MNNNRVWQAAPVHNAKYFFGSPTYNKWVKLTAADIHALHEIPGFEGKQPVPCLSFYYKYKQLIISFTGQKIYFHLNHPIRFVYLVAPIVAIQDIPNTKFFILTLDDSSNACIDVKIEREDAAKVDADSTSNTTVPNLDINVAFGYDSEIKIDGQKVDIGSVIKAKCTVGSFRGVKQLELKRCGVMKDTTEEVAAWESMAEFKRDVLAVPWTLSTADKAALDTQLQQEAMKEQEEEKRERRSQRAHQKREEQRAERRKAREQEKEQRRLASERKYNQGALI